MGRNKNGKNKRHACILFQKCNKFQSVLTFSSFKKKNQILILDKVQTLQDTLKR